MHKFWMPYSLRTPTYMGKALFGKAFKIARCKTDGGLVTEAQSSLFIHAGHSLTDPVILTNLEWLFIKIGIIYG